MQRLRRVSARSDHVELRLIFAGLHVEHPQQRMKQVVLRHRRRRRLLAQRLKATQAQVFVSAIATDHVIDMSDEKGKMFRVEQGKIAVQPED